MPIFLSQWLCPSRHCAIALAWDPATNSAEAVEAQGESYFRPGGFNPWCGICQGSLKVEHAPTRFQTMEEALPVLNQLEAAQLATRYLLDHQV